MACPSLVEMFPTSSYGATLAAFGTTKRIRRDTDYCHSNWWNRETQFRIRIWAHDETSFQGGSLL
jgi:hypothetical protein